MTDYEFQVDGFMLYCTSKNLSRKTLASYKQSLKLFGIYLQQEFLSPMLERIQRKNSILMMRRIRVDSSLLIYSVKIRGILSLLMIKPSWLLLQQLY